MNKYNNRNRNSNVCTVVWSFPYLFYCCKKKWYWDVFHAIDLGLCFAPRTLNKVEYIKICEEILQMPEVGISTGQWHEWKQLVQFLHYHTSHFCLKIVLWLEFCTRHCLIYYQWLLDLKRAAQSLTWHSPVLSAEVDLTIVRMHFSMWGLHRTCLGIKVIMPEHKNISTSAWAYF